LNTEAGKIIRKVLIEEKGLTPGTKEYRRAYERMRWHTRTRKSKAKCGRPKTVKKKATRKKR